MVSPELQTLSEVNDLPCFLSRLHEPSLILWNIPFFPIVSPKLGQTPLPRKLPSHNQLLHIPLILAQATYSRPHDFKKPHSLSPQCACVCQTKYSTDNAQPQQHVSCSFPWGQVLQPGFGKT